MKYIFALVLCICCIGCNPHKDASDENIANDISISQNDCSGDCVLSSVHIQDNKLHEFHSELGTSRHIVGFQGDNVVLQNAYGESEVIINALNQEDKSSILFQKQVVMSKTDKIVLYNVNGIEILDDSCEISKHIEFPDSLGLEANGSISKLSDLDLASFAMLSQQDWFILHISTTGEVLLLNLEDERSKIFNISTWIQLTPQEMVGDKVVFSDYRGLKSELTLLTYDIGSEEIVRREILSDSPILLFPKNVLATKERAILVREKNIDCFDDNMNELWSTILEEEITHSLITRNNELVIVQANNIVRKYTKDGIQIEHLRLNIDGDIRNLCELDSGIIVVMSDWKVYALWDSVLTLFQIDCITDRLVVGPVARENEVVFGDNTGKMYYLDVKEIELGPELKS